MSEWWHAQSNFLFLPLSLSLFAQVKTARIIALLAVHSVSTKLRDATEWLTAPMERMNFCVVSKPRRQAHWQAHARQDKLINSLSFVAAGRERMWPFKFLVSKFSRVHSSGVPMRRWIWLLQRSWWKGVWWVMNNKLICDVSSCVIVDCNNCFVLNFCGTEKPRMLEQPQKLYTVERGKSITLTCRASGMPKPKIEWRFNLQRIPDAASSSISVCTTCHNCADNESLSSLTVNQFDERFEGRWTCEAVNSLDHELAPHDTELTLRPASPYVSGRVY